MFTIDTRVKDSNNIERVRDAIYAAIEEAKTKPVSAERLSSIKSHMKYQFAMGLNSPERVARSVGNYINLTGDPEAVNRLYQLYDKVSPEDIMMVANKYFTKNNRTVILLRQEETKQ